MTLPMIGDTFVSNTGFGSNLSARAMAAAVRWGTSSPYNHAGIYVGDGQVVEAQPGGARYADVEQYLGENTLWAAGELLPGYDWTQVSFGLRVANYAEALIDLPYDWADIVAIIFAQKRFRQIFGWSLDATKPIEEQPWPIRRIARTDRLICSELVDYAHFLADIQLFDDGRPFGLVSPGDIGRLITEKTTGPRSAQAEGAPMPPSIRRA